MCSSLFGWRKVNIVSGNNLATKQWWSIDSSPTHTCVTRVLYYYCDITLSQDFKAIGAQCPLKAALPLAKRIATASYPLRWLFTQSFIQTQITENTKAPRHWPLCGEFTGDRWIPRTNGQLRGKCFHLMTSSCIVKHSLQSLKHFNG